MTDAPWKTRKDRNYLGTSATRDYVRSVTLLSCPGSKIENRIKKKLGCGLSEDKRRKEKRKGGKADSQRLST
jgi:hypothetical protein